MKTQEQIKQEIVNYLTKTSAHTFIKPKSTFKWAKEGSYYEYDYNEFTYFKIMIKDGEFYSLEKSGTQGYRVSKIDIDNYIKYWGNNAKCVLSNNLFLNKKMKSVKSNTYHLGEIERIVNEIN